MIDFKDKNIVVFGLARSGIASAKKLASFGAKVLVTESKPASEIDSAAINKLRKLKIDIELGGHSRKSIEKAELIVVSPGIRLDIPILEQAKQNNIPIISEVELAYQLLKKPIIAVTGTNGKTTTTTLIGELLKAGKKKVAVAGNIGFPLIEVNDADLDYIVAEISSYQLESIDKFKPWISVILNIQPDHLERHKTMSEYIRQKERIFLNQRGDDYLVYNLDDQAVVKMAQKAKARLIGFTKSNPEIITLKPAEIKIPGRHNLENALAAAQAAYLCGVSKENVAHTLRNFAGVEHRIEFVSDINGIEFYNDSKATNPDSTLVALETFKGRDLVLILGGRDKGTELETLTEKIKQAVREVILIGEASERFRKTLEQAGFNNIHQAQSFNESVSTSYKLARAGSVVLLSPACASFDMFNNFEERGRAFKKEVNKLS